MANNSLSIQERMSEAVANAQAAMVVKILSELAVESSTKRFVRSRATRIARWQELADLAAGQAAALSVVSKQAAARKPRTPRAVPIEKGHIGGGQNVQSVPQGTPGIVADQQATLVS